MKMEPMKFAAMSRRIQDGFNTASKVQLGIASVALPLLTLRFSVGALWALHAFVALAALALSLVVLQGLLLAAESRANHWAGEWFVSAEREKAEKALKTQPRKGWRKPAGHEPCPCGSGERYRSCCRPRHQMAPAVQ